MPPVAAGGSDLQHASFFKPILKIIDSCAGGAGRRREAPAAQRKGRDTNMTDYLKYQGTKCVVLGGSSGMGKACTAMLVDQGAEVYVLDLMPCDVPGIKAYVEMDLGNRESIKAAFDQLPKIDKFFGYAGISGRNDKGDVIAVNTLSYMYIMDELLFDKMNDYGAAMFNASIAGENWEKNYESYRYLFEHTWEESVAWARAGAPGARGSIYMLSKQALNYYVVKHMIRYGTRWIRMNCLSPGLTKSRLRQDFVDGYPGDESELSGAALKRDAEVEDQARCGVAINSDLFGYVTGQIVYCDGGHHAAAELVAIG